jgi:uncharacterized protein YodC (DUF2158 family)
MSTFKIGNVVVLKSGSSEMTVTNTGNHNGVPHVWCTWRNKDGKDEVGFYPADAVMLATDKEPPVVNRDPPGGSWAGARRG